MLKMYVAALAVFATSGVFAEVVKVHKTTDTVDVTFTSTDCTVPPKTFFVVIDGNDLEPIPVTRLDTDPCRWVGKRRGTSPFSTERAFSLRFFTGARSVCRQARAVRDDKGEYVAELAFPYEAKNARALTITAIPHTTYVRYLREVPANELIDESVACLESGEFKGKRTVHDVSFNIENLLLRLAPAAKSATFIELMVDDVIQNELLRPKKDGRVLLGPQEVVYALMRQRARLPAKATLNFGSNAIDHDRMKFEKGLPDTFDLTSIELALGK